MTRHIGACLLTTVAFVAGTFVPVVWTQQGPIQGTGEYVVLNCMKVPAAAHQARVRDGKMKSWALWQNRSGGTEDACSFLTINTYNKLAR